MNPILSFLRQTHARFMAESPVYFKVYTTVTFVLGLVVAMPEFLQLVGIEVPKLLTPHMTVVVTAALWAQSFTAKLTAKDPEQLNK